MTLTREQFGLFFPFYFVALWIGVGFFLSRLGWCGFAQKYGAAVRPAGRSFNCRSAWFGTTLASYRNVMRVIFSEAGIYIYPLFLFRTFHPPFLVPWEKVVGVSKRERFWTTWNELEVRDGTEEIHIMLSDAAFHEYQKFRST